MFDMFLHDMFDNIVYILKENGKLSALKRTTDTCIEL